MFKAANTLPDPPKFLRINFKIIREIVLLRPLKGIAKKDLN
jgi:hypothetical protein